MALEAMRRAYATDPVKEMLEARHKAELAENTRLNAAVNQGKIEARAEGKAEGRAEGRTEALRETARNLLAQGIAAEVVAAATGLDLQEVLKL